MRNPGSSSKYVIAALAAAALGLTAGPELRAASAERGVKKGKRKTPTAAHRRSAQPANTTPPQR